MSVFNKSLTPLQFNATVSAKEDLTMSNFYKIGDKVLDEAFEGVGHIIHIDDDSPDAPYVVLFKQKNNQDRQVCFYSEEELNLYIAPKLPEELN